MNTPTPLAFAFADAAAGGWCCIASAIFCFFHPFFMATRSFISRSIEDGFEGVYCHWDGYLEHVGALLLQYWSDPEKLGELIALGDISVLGTEIGEAHNFDDRLFQSESTNGTTFYGRDRGETGVGPKTFLELDDLVHYADKSGCEYIYVLDQGNWYFIDRGAQFFGLSDGAAYSDFKRVDKALMVA